MSVITYKRGGGGLRGEYYPCKPDVFHKKYELLETEVECVKSKYGDNPIYSSDLTKHTYPLELIGLTSAKGWREIADTYGDAQVFLLIEEMSELTQSLTKYMRYKGKGQPVRKPFYTVMDSITGGEGGGNFQMFLLCYHKYNIYLVYLLTR